MDDKHLDCQISSSSVFPSYQVKICGLHVSLFSRPSGVGLGTMHTDGPEWSELLGVQLASLRLRWENCRSKGANSEVN